MSEVGRYRKAYPRIWRHPGFRQLSRDEQRLVLYLLYGPQSNRIGLFHFSIFTAAEDLDTTPETLKKGLANVTVTFGWMFDADARVFYIPSWWRWNPPENVKVIKGSLKDLNEIPPSALVDAFATNIDALSDIADKDGHTVRETFLDGLRQRLPKRMPIQNQYQEFVSGSRKQEPSALRAVASRESIPWTPNGPLEIIAREVVGMSPSECTVEYLIDAVLNASRNAGLKCTRKEALTAIAAAGVKIA